MAVNLDKEAYYRRIKRLYSNWKVNPEALRWIREKTWLHPAVIERRLRRNLAFQSKCGDT
uniref:Uncharacterized protein n=1 Tax=Periophthalmus magnuspinnatus TaxID=409849 RepID=A0A3B3Z8C5_9GOBI